MSKDKNNKNEGLLKSVFMACFILILHVILIACVGVVVFLFGGMVQYMVWILAGAFVSFLIFCVLFYRRMKKEGKSLREMMNSPVFQGQSLEVSLLGGLASVKISKERAGRLLENGDYQEVQLLEDTASIRIRKLNELARLLENNLITIDEYNQTKQEIFKNYAHTG